MQILIAGGGQVGMLVARRLTREGNEVVIVDPSADRCADLEARLDVKVVHGNAARILTLRQAGIADAEMIIAVTDNDEVNLIVCLMAQVESRARIKVARVRTHEFEQWRMLAREAGITVDLMIHPETELADRIMRIVGLPGVFDLREFAGGEVRLLGLILEPGHWTIGRSLEDLVRQGPPPESLIAMIFRGQQVIIPHGGEVLREDDRVYVMTSRRSMEATLQFMGRGEPAQPKRVFILGGKQLGIGVATLLEQQGVQVKLFEKDPARARRIAALLTDTVVIGADGMDDAALQEAGIDRADAFLALTGDDEDNIIASLLGRRAGVRKVVALINRLDYLPMMQRLGIGTTVSPRLAAVDGILQFVRKGRVMSVTTFGEEEAEAIEVLAAPDSRYVGRPLKALRLPRSAIIGAIVRPSGDVLVPRGDAVIQPGDRLIIFALERIVPELEAAFLAPGHGRRP